MLPAALADKINIAAAKTVNERREVTVLFVDVFNFTAASHQLDSEDVYLFIDEAMSLLADVVHKYEGTIDKFTGDGLMALFGAPRAHENDPERAVRAALEMQSSIKPFRKQMLEVHGLDFQIRIGVNTGAVVAGKLGNQSYKEYTVIGDTVNLASRLETAAEPGTVLVSAETYQRTQTLFSFEVVQGLTLKGIPQSVQGYRVIALLENPGRVRGLAGLQVPMVGRHDDLKQLIERLSEVKRHSHPQIALITGEAGLGKSRIVAEFQRSIDHTKVQVYQGGCLDYARSRPLWVVAEILRDMVPIAEAETLEQQQIALQGFLEHLNLPQDEILPYLLHTLGLPQIDAPAEARLQMMDAITLQQQTHTAMRRVLLAKASGKTTVLIFEDLHWLDPASRDFLTYFIETIDRVSFMLVLISRPATQATSVRSILAAVNKTTAHVLDLHLQALAKGPRQELVDQLICNTTPYAQRLKQQIAERAAGNPFFTEEIIRRLIDQGGLVKQANGIGWKVTQQANTLIQTVPGTINGLIFNAI